MFRLLRRIMSLLFVVALLCQSFDVFALNILVSTNVTKQVVPGIVHYRYSILASEGWVTADVAEIDTDNPNYEFKVLTSDNGTQNLVTVRTLAQQNNAILATNADFFNWGTGTAKGSPIGIVVKDGTLVSTPAATTNMASFFQTFAGNFSAEHISFNITLTAPNGNSLTAGALNKLTDLSQPCIYDRGFGEIYNGGNYNIAKVVVVNDIVEEITYNPGAYTIPENGYILAYLPDYYTFAADNLSVGDKLDYSVALTPSLDNIKEAVGAGTMLVKDGQVTNITHGETGRHPRTAIGVNYEGNKLYFVTVDGRQSHSIGMTLTELQYFLLSIGVYTGANFDGGGSTTFAYRNVGETTVNTVNSISDSSPRPVTNAVSIMPKGSTGVLDSFYLKAGSGNVFANTGIEIDCIGLDKYYNPVEVNMDQVEFSSPNGDFSGNVFRPYSAGTAEIKAQLGSAQGSLTLKVLEAPHSLSVSPSTIDLTKSDKVYAAVTGKDKDGYSAPIDLRDLSPQIIDASADRQGNNLVKTGGANGYLRLELGGAISYAPIKTNGSGYMPPIPNGSFLIDPQRRMEDQGFKFAVFGELQAPKTLLQLGMLTKAVKDLNNTDMVSFVGTVNPTVAEAMGDKLFSANNYSIKTNEDSAFIILNDRNGGLKSASSTQWPWFVEKCNYLEQKNLFVMLPSEIYGGFKDSRELDAFFNVLEQQVSKGKNVYLLAHDSVTNTIRRNGIRYITTNGISQTVTVNNVLEQISGPKYILFTINGDQVTYEYKSIY